MTTPNTPAEELRRWLRNFGFREDPSGWMLRANVRAQFHDDALTLYVVDRTADRRWSVRLVNPPRQALTALLSIAAATT